MKNDKKLILKFLDEIQMDIGFVVENVYSFSSEHRKFDRMLKDAWREIIPRFAEMREKVKELDSNTLIAVGLSGHQLILKYEIYQTAREKFRNAIRTDDSTKKENNERIFKSTMALFKIMDSFLSSLTVVIPHVHVVKGFKESIEDIISLDS
jgi:hypothetical protein